ncbi:PucR family transcriptional regulator [Mycobacterium sp. 663a-19]|uniref:PucR family transcriptional regulator n=1 Tax=Mycobacterium sp. 663a-19 TaxID=2986148 RepID=UPI002D1E7811|nr:PucR family transcriptional regulator [Mycobacterium sp. 663a-19]MEB3981433.1 PucR family transcriptional regulator [Mycobacterium sp. 663a-19]
MDSQIAAVATRLSERAPDIAAAICAALEDNIAELPSDDPMVRLLHGAVQDHIRTVMGALLHDTPAEQITAPAASIDYALRLARHNVPINELLRAHRLGQRRMTELVVAELQAFGLERTARVAAIEAITTALLRYVDAVELQALAAYQGERKLVRETRSAAREMHVRDLLDDDTSVDVDAASTAIGYPLGWQHLALVVWYPDGQSAGDQDARLQRFVGDLAKTVEASASALLTAAEAGAWAWLPYRAPPGDVVNKIRDYVGPQPDAPNIAIGAMGRGVNGFRRSHRQALRARTAGLARSGRERVLVAATDPGILAAALLAAGVEEIRGWVADTLGPLASDTDDDARLRHTLRGFLRSGVVTPAVERAVARRGRPMDDRVDVELALLACRWYGADVLQPG